MEGASTNIAIIQNVPIEDHRMVHIDGIATELTKRGYYVNVIIQQSSQSQTVEEKIYNITYLSGDTYSINGQIKFIRNLYNYLKENSFSIIHAKNPFSSVLPALLVKKNEKIIYDERGLWIEFGVHAHNISKWVSPFLHFIENYCLKKSDLVIVISNELKKILIKKGLNEDKIFVTSGDGVNLNYINNIQKIDLKKRYDIDGDILGYVGGIGRSRHSDKIIQSMSILKNKYDHNFKLFMIGPFGENEEHYFNQLIKEKRLEDYVIFTGLLHHNEAIQYMKAFDVAISYHEQNLDIFNVAVPTKILEYLGSGCSIVTTDHEMYQNILTHKEDGFLTSQNPESFAKGIKYILDNKILSQKMRKNAIKTAEKYNIIKITDIVEKVYLTVVNDYPNKKMLSN